MVWFEVEAKVKIQNINSLRKKVRKIAGLKKTEAKNDDYFALKGKFRNVYPKKAFRVRRRENVFEINFKKWIKEDWDNEVVVKKEFEFSIKNKEAVSDLLALFRDLGFVKWIQKRKLSETYLHKKDKRIAIEINKVAKLGYFMEIEYLAQPSEINKAKRKIKKVLKELEIDKRDIDNTGYTKMLWDLKR